MSSERRKAGLAAAKARGKTLSAASTRQASRGGPMRLLVLRRCGLCHGDGVEQAIHSDPTGDRWHAMQVLRVRGSQCASARPSGQPSSSQM
jgi:hypothetical protein